MRIQKEKILIILTVFIDVLGVGIIIPILPFYVESFGAGPLTLTLLFSVFSLCSFLSAPVLGALSDKIGRRPVLILSIASTAVGWMVFASAHAVWVLFLGRIIDGMAAGNFPIAQSYFGDLAKDDKERAANLGKIGAIFGIAFILGPMIGSLLSLVSRSFPFWFVGGLAAANMIGAFFFLPETHHDRNNEEKINLNPFSPLRRAASDALLRSRYVIWFLFGLATSMLQAIFALYMGAQFGLQPKFIGFVFGGMGILMAFNQGFMLRNFWLKYFKESALEIWLFLSFAAAFILMGLGSWIFFILGMLLNVFSQSTLRVVVSSRASGIAGSKRRGEVMGVMSSVLSAAMVIGPIVAGAVFEKHPSMPFMLGSVALLAAFVVMKTCCKKEESGYDKDQIVPEAL